VNTDNILIEVREIRKAYKTGKIELEVLKGVNLDVKENEFVAIMGPSGSGKSTLMNIVGCLDITDCHREAETAKAHRG